MKAAILSFAVLLLLPSAALVHAQSIVVEPAPMPASSLPMSQPHLSMSPVGALLLSWIEKSADGSHRLRFSTMAAKAGDWSTPRTIASGSDWFVNWADTPHLVALGNGDLWAHWLRKTGTGPMEYGIELARSADAGATWSAPIRVQPDGAKGDYGFVTFWREASDRVGIAWLDSRLKQPGDGHGHDHHTGIDAGTMSLRSALFDADGQRHAERLLDPMTCDCCPTASTETAEGLVVVYRGRSADEIRDTRIVRRGRDGQWSAPTTVHDDGWRFAGCPVNGPAVAADGNDVRVAWFTEAGGKPELRLARSTDAGRRFATPRTIAQGADLLGRVAVTLDRESLWLTWLEQDSAESNRQRVMLARFDPASGDETGRVALPTSTASGRASGLPRIVSWKGDAWLVWTDRVGDRLVLRGARAKRSIPPM